jgi:hypothetical protein
VAPDPIRGFLHISIYPWLSSASPSDPPKKIHGLFVFDILRAIHHGNDFAHRADRTHVLRVSNKTLHEGT